MYNVILDIKNTDNKVLSSQVLDYETDNYFKLLKYCNKQIKSNKVLKMINEKFKKSDNVKNYSFHLFCKDGKCGVLTQNVKWR